MGTSIDTERASRDAALQFAEAAMVGLCDRPRWLPSRFLYDDRGSLLFDAITQTPEYYPTRTESMILGSAAAEIAARTGAVTVVELGAGNSRKTGTLLAAYAARQAPVPYVPVDISGAALRAGREGLGALLASVNIKPVHGTYEAVFPMLRELAPVLLVFLGSTVGNLDQADAARFWSTVSGSLPVGSFMLLGVDLVKDPEVINAAYNDAEGHSAAFTRNIFHRMNSELGTAIDLSAIDHVARYNPEWERVEIFAAFRTDQYLDFKPLGAGVRLYAGDRVMTEISRKFVLDRLQQYLGAFRLAVRQVHTDPRRWFALLLLERVEVVA